jgi:hypothetical protein
MNNESQKEYVSTWVLCVKSYYWEQSHKWVGHDLSC